MVINPCKLINLKLTNISSSKFVLPAIRFFYSQAKKEKSKKYINIYACYCFQNLYIFSIGMHLLDGKRSKIKLYI